ncbi:Metal-dependent hydrolase, endonuclease/exonuclease/phosphatase family [Spirosomataceae bacterium TFI 002]|nr:Metal-dependent hydrolase, endonuclease/exonuclease/phosphatase family [Spirosomataceae bacterium TFI 002]
MTKLLVLSLVCFASFGQTHLTAISFNIRYATPNDGINQWENRKDKVVELLNFYEPDVFGMQEALKHQIDYVHGGLSDYKWVGVGRDDGKEKGEYAPLFYNASKFSLLENGTFWLAENTSVPGKSWDAALPRIATYARLKMVNGKTVFVLNTHYDHRGELARKNSSKVILNKLKELVHVNEPVVFMGDFNAVPTEEPIKVFLDEKWNHYRLSSTEKHLGPIGTFSGFESKEGDKEIDHIFYNDHLKLYKSATLSPTWGGLFASDHHAILADFIILE